MQGSIATAQRSSTPQSDFAQSGKSLLSWLWSMSTALSHSAASALLRIFERFDSGISNSINIDRVSARLRVAQRARTDGRNEYPPSGEESISGTQREIIAYFKDLQRRAQRRISVLADKSRRMREKIDLAGIEGSLRDIPSRCENDVLRMLAESNSFKHDAVEQTRHHSREEAAESRAADQSIPVLLQLAFLAALVGIGAMLLGNTLGFEFSAESPVPPVWTFVILLAVVALSSITARAVSTSIAYHVTLWKLRKWLRAGIGIAFIGLASVFASHYLSAMTAAPGASWDTTLSAVFGRLFVETTAPLLPVQDWTVFAIVLAAALIAFIVCYQPDTAARKDAALHGPGHHARKQRALLIRQLRKVNMKIDRAEAEVTETLKHTKAAIGKYARIVDESRHLSKKLGDYDYVLEDACNMLLDRYRAENSKVRTTQAPHSFQEHVCFRAEDEAGSASFADERRHLDELQQGIVKLESQAGQIRQELRALNSRAIGSLEEAAIS